MSFYDKAYEEYTNPKFRKYQDDNKKGLVKISKYYDVYIKTDGDRVIKPAKCLYCNEFVICLQTQNNVISICESCITELFQNYKKEMFKDE